MEAKEDVAEALASEHSMAIAAIGTRVRSLRQEKGLTLQQLSAAAGVSQSMLSLVERGKASASIGTLFSVATALGVPASDLLAEDPAPRQNGVVMRVSEQPLYEIEPGVTWRVVRHDRARGVEIVINEYEPETGSTQAPIHHQGYEYGVVLDGTLTVEIDGVRHVMRRGDSIAYSSSKNHKLWNYGRTRARALWMIIT
ncbi:MAG TPA: cupin domain-containing protein [Xanthobacteraceae bacterium]|jgi:transcriptional regulator with XRE-family HTH domain